jgi:uncharacterized membrane protein required for colicin V production
MVSLTVLFGMLVALFAVIGAMRGWAKELLVTAALMLGLFLNAILDNYVTTYRTAMMVQPPLTQFLLRGGVLVLLAFFGYQTPHIRALQPKLARERMEEILLGLVLGALNGYLLIGSLFFYLDQTGYPTSLIIPPAADSTLRAQIDGVMKWVAPSLLPIPQLYFAVGVVFVFIIVVFV